MLTQLPIVATNVSSIPEIIADGQTGLLVPPDDQDALADALARVLADPGNFGAAGRERARAQFSVARMADATLAVYREVTRV